MTAYVAIKGGREDAYEPWWACAGCGSYDLEEWLSGTVKCRSCTRLNYLTRVNPVVAEMEDGGLTVEGPSGRLARYQKGVWIAYRHTDPSAEQASDALE